MIFANRAFFTPEGRVTDAAVEGSNVNVRVDFKQYRISSSEIPGYEQYVSKIKRHCIFVNRRYGAVLHIK